MHTIRRSFSLGARFYRTSPIGAIGGIVLLFVIIVAIFANQLAPFDPLVSNVTAINDPPQGQHVLGTDNLGRDVLSRLIFGARITLIVAFTSIFLGDSIGFMWGLMSGYLGGRVDLISQRVLDIMISFPTIILALLLLAVMGAGLGTVIFAIAIVTIPRSTRVIRSRVLSVKEMSYVEVARAMGASPLRIMLFHVAPQTVGPFLVVLSVGLGVAIFAESALSFLGVGIPPPDPSWGNMLSGALGNLFNPPWWIVLFPGLAITFTIMAFNLFGDGLRDFFDPRLRGTL